MTILLSAFPVYWMFVVASIDRGGARQDPAERRARRATSLDNFQAVFTADNVYFVKSLVNSLARRHDRDGVGAVLLLAGRIRLRQAAVPRPQRAAWWCLIATLAVPNQLGVVALYILMGKLGWNGELQAVIVPSLVTAFGVFYMRQFILDAVPDELIEAARVDGASTFRIYASVVLPRAAPGRRRARPVHVRRHLERLPVAADHACPAASTRRCRSR